MKPNVLHLIDSFEQGGTERQAVQLIGLLQASGRYRVHLACFRGEGALREEVERLGLGEIPEFPLTSFHDRNFLTQIGRFRRFLRERDIHIVHTHGLYTNIFGMTGAAAARIGVRIASRRETVGMRTAAQKWAERCSYRLADRVVSNAEAVRRQLIVEGVPERKIITLYNGLDMERVRTPREFDRTRSLASFNLPLERGRRFVTIVANVGHPVKDHPMFLRAASRVRRDAPEAAFVIAGEGELLESLRTLAAQLGLERDAFFIGRCSDLASLLAISDVCVLSSKAEGFSNSILEYMAAARPVVATDVGGAREAIVEGETGYLVSSGDDEALAARIVSLLGDPVRARRMGERGQRVVAERFSCDAQLANMEKLYDELLARRMPAAESGELKGMRRKRA